MTNDQRKFLSDTFKELANLTAGALVLGQAFTHRLNVGLFIGGKENA
jgi:hypothetical protein